MSAAAVARPSHTPSHSPSEADRGQPAPRSHFHTVTPLKGRVQTPILEVVSSPQTSDLMAASPAEVASAEQNGVHQVESRTVQGSSEAQPETHSSASKPVPQAKSPVDIKTERPGSPRQPQPTPTAMSRRRPHRLDINTTASIPPARPSAPLTSKESGGLSALQDAAISCLSPGFDTSDPQRRQQMERSRDLAEQQRQIINSRQTKGRNKDFGPPPSSFSKPLGTSRRKAAPSSLALSSESALNEPRVIQSAPLGQTFTGLHRATHPLSRQVLDHSLHHHHHAAAYGDKQASRHAHAHPPTIQPPPSATRLPPIQDVFAHENLGSSRPSSTGQRDINDMQRPSTINGSGQVLYAPITNAQATHSPLPASLPATDSARGNMSSVHHLDESKIIPQDSHNSGQQSGSGTSSNLRQHDREYRSADEAVHSMTGGREELLPKLVHYGGHQPPTPPSPLPPTGYGSRHTGQSAHSERPASNSLKMETGQREEPHHISGRRRTREEYERDLAPREVDEHERERERLRERDRGGVGYGFGAWTNDGRARHSPETMRRKKDEFVTLCARAWDLLHE